MGNRHSKALFLHGNRAQGAIGWKTGEMANHAETKRKGRQAKASLKGTLNVRVMKYRERKGSIIDNSGALVAEGVNLLKQKVNNSWGSVGDEIVVVIQRARPVSAAASASVTAVKVHRGEVRRAIIVRTRKPVRRPDGRGSTTTQPYC
ncbi:hypothetical protein K438DRAFT_1764046 [Mycena galopus ATCC 62051]|nr:hypothetical protein K438DRAFT_1764046 [Mycena galopus ATCC 62051]